MEFYFMATGPMHWLNLFETHLQGQDFNIPGIDARGRPINQAMKGMLEPINLYRYIIPKNALPIVAKTLKVDAPNPLFTKMRPQIWAMRKALGLQEVPKENLPEVVMPISTEHLQIIPIGIKEDEEGMIPTTGVQQEKL